MTWDEIEAWLKANPGVWAYRQSDPPKHRWRLRWGGPGELRFWWKNPTTGSEHPFAVTEADKNEKWAKA